MSTPTTRRTTDRPPGPILFCNFSDTYGGQERWLEGLVVELTSRYGVTADFLGGPQRLARSPVFRNAVPMSPVLRPRWRDPALEILAPDCALVLLSGNRALYRNALRSILPGRPRVYVQHSMFYDGQAPAWRRLVRRWMLPRLLDGVDAIVRVSHGALPLELRGKRVHTIHNGVDAERFRPSPRHFGGPPRTLLMVGSLTKNKNQELAIRALAKLPEMRLVLAGRGPDEARQRELARRLGVADRVQFCGFVADPAECYARADVFLMLSRHEGLPLALLEAMASGLPVVATRMGGVAEVVRDREDGLLLPALATPEDVADRLSRLSRQPELVRELGEGARRRVGDRFTLDRMAREYRELFSSLASATTKPPARDAANARLPENGAPADPFYSGGPLPSRQPAGEPIREKLLYREGRFLGIQTERGSIEVGIEFGTVSTFFSSLHPEHCRIESFEECHQERSLDRMARTLRVGMPGVRCEIAEDVRLEANSLRRHLEFRMIEDSWLTDLVSRYAARDGGRRAARIGHEDVRHENRNRYVHRDVPQATIPFGLSGTLSVEREQGLATPERFHRWLYVRDEPSANGSNRWVLHHRVLVAEPEELVLRGCSRWFNRPLPPVLNCLVPRAVRRSLYMVRETRWPKAPLMTVGAARLAAGSVVVFRDKATW